MKNASQQPLSPAPPPGQETTEWVHYALGVKCNIRTGDLRATEWVHYDLGVECNTQTGDLRATADAVARGDNLPLLPARREWCQLVLDLGGV